MVKLMFVCLGNICRSPMAEAVFNDLLEKRNLKEYFDSYSAGTAGYHIGKQADRRTTETLEKAGINFHHTAKKLSVTDFNKYDHIVVMDEANFEFVHNLYHTELKKPPPPEKVFLIRDYDPQVRGVHEVPDPYYGSDKEFREVYDILLRSCNALIDHLIDFHKIVVVDEEE